MTSDTQDVLYEIGIQIDSAGDSGDANALLALDARCAALLESNTSISSARLWYFRSNVYASLQDMEDARSWDWRQPHRERQILYLRRARASADFDNLGPLEAEQILTNLANQLNSLGRSIEAIAMYDEALAREPRFAMALGNRGYALFELAKLLHDPGHGAVALLFAHDNFAKALKDSIWDGPHHDAHRMFHAYMKKIDSMLNLDHVRQHLHSGRYSLGDTRIEVAYRTWALTHQLFLNPLNALCTHPIAATDALNLPSHKGSIDDPPHFIAWFNQLKQEYCAARLFLFESEDNLQSHYADRQLSLVDTLDAPAFGIAVEKLRVAFRIAYGLLDKVAGFVNAYFQLGDNPNRVDMRNIWLTKKGALRDAFIGRQNLPLRGLYWLAFDLTGDSPDDPDSIEPHSKRLKDLRNSLEHRCLILRDSSSGWQSSLIETLTVGEFRQDCFSIIRLAHAAIIYLAFSMFVEERTRNENDGVISVPVELPTYVRGGTATQPLDSEELE